MINPSHSREYDKLSIHDLLRIVSDEFQKEIKETFATVNMNLEVAHKLEPNEEELEFVFAKLKSMEAKFLEHIYKEEQLLFPIFSVAKKRLRSIDEKNNFEKFINSLKAEHNWIKEQINLIRKATRNYQCEPSNTPSHKLAFAQLNDLEQDIHKIFFVEEEFLFRRALKFEGK